MDLSERGNLYLEIALRMGLFFLMFSIVVFAPKWIMYFFG